MIETLLQEKRNYVREILMNRPDVLARFGPSIVPMAIIIIAGITAGWLIWTSGDKLALMLPLDKIPFENNVNILQLKILATSILSASILAVINFAYSARYTITTEYITVEKTGRRPHTEIIMLDDISNISSFTGIAGAIGQFCFVRLTRKDGSAISLFAVPMSKAKKIKQLCKDVK